MPTNPHDTLPGVEPGKLILTPCPGGKGVALAQSLARCGETRANTAIDMTPEVATPPEAVDQAGMRWFCPDV